MTDKKQSLLLLAAASSMLLVGCAKEKPYDEKFKGITGDEAAIYDKASISLTNTEEVTAGQSYVTTQGVIKKADKTQKLDVARKYIYVPMTLGTPREVSAADPFYQGKEKLVTLKWTNSGLDVIEYEKDSRFADNRLNSTPVLTIPVTHIDYKCREDSYGKCTNVEEEDTEKPKLQRRKFRPDFKGLKIAEVNDLDVFTLSADSCHRVIDTKVTKAEIGDGVINIHLEKTFKLSSSISCLWDNYVEDKFSYNSFKVQYSYSIVALDKIATPGYQPLEYPIPDHDEFGFFENEKLTLDDNFDSQRKIKTNLLNRFSPNQPNGELVYHLSDTFNKPENKLLKEATYEAVEVMNKSLGRGGIPFKIALKEPSGKNAGDLRYNMINLIDDPLANGLLGYGPSVSNPLTGEILKAHTNMYSGVLRSMTRRVWQAAVDLSVDKVKEANPAGIKSDMKIVPEALSNIKAFADQHVAGFTPESAAGEETEEKSDTVSMRLSAQVKEISHLIHESLEHKLDHKHLSLDDIKSERITKNQLKKKLNERMKRQENSKIYKSLLKNENDRSLTEFERSMIKEDLRLRRYAENNAYAVEFFPIAGTSKVIYPEMVKIAGVKNADGSLKNWTELTREQQSLARDIILKRNYISTLVHELGHNLGLRHNFSGSVDKDNFYSEQEAQELGLDAVPAYSSIMDYSFSEYNSLEAFGKYDVAALRFAYARKVELANGQIVPINKPISDFDKDLATAGLERKAYMFCTDGNAGLSSLCNRFDEGTTLVEVAKYRIKRYKDAYKYRNFRDGRLDFSSYDMSAYLYWRQRELMQIRDILEEYEFFVGFFGPGLMNQGCTPAQVQQFPVCGMINERRDAVRLVGDFFADILKTPDHLCALAKPEAPNVVVKYEKLYDIYDEVRGDVPKSCFEAKVKNYVATDMSDENGQPTSYIVVGENGKFLNGFKGNDPNFKYSSDRATRGVWADKVVATKALFARKWRNRSTDSDHMALMDVPYVFNKVAPFLAHLSIGMPIQEPLAFTAEDGSKFVLPYAIGEDYEINPLEDVFSSTKASYFLPNNGYGDLRSTILSQVLGSVMARDRRSGDHFVQSFGTKYEDATYTSVNFAGVTRRSDELSNPGDKIGTRVNDYFYYATKENVLARIMINSINAKEALSKLSAAEMTDLITRLNAGEDVKSVTIASGEEVVLNFDMEYINNFLQNELTDGAIEYYKKNLKELNGHIRR